MDISFFYKKIGNLLLFFLSLFATLILLAVEDKEKEWFTAAREGNVKELKNMLKKNKNLLTYQGEVGMTALHAVIKSGKVTVDQKISTISFLLEKAKEFGEIDYINTYMTQKEKKSERYNALTLAAGANMSIKIMASIVNAAEEFGLQLKINQQDSKYGISPFLEACYSNNKEVLIFLFDHFQDLNLNVKTQKYGYTGLLIAAKLKHYGIMKSILEKVKALRLQLDVNSTIEYDGNNNYSALALLLYNYKYDTDSNEIVAKKVKNLIKSLIELGAEIDEQAKKWGEKVDILKFMEGLVKKQKLVNDETKPNSSIEQPTQTKPLRKAEKVKKWLNAAERGDITTLDRMINENRELLTYQGKAGMTALHAVINSYKITVNRINKTVIWLLEQAQKFGKVDYINTYMKQKDWERYNALMLAAARPNMGVKIMETIVKAAKDFGLQLKINEQDPKYGSSPFLEACYRGNEKVVIFLFDHFQDLNLNIKTIQGYTGLLMVAKFSNYDIMKRILVKAKELNFQLDVNSQINQNSNYYSALALLLYNYKYDTHRNELVDEVKSLITSLIGFGAKIDKQAEKWGKETDLLEFMKNLVKQRELVNSEVKQKNPTDHPSKTESVTEKEEEESQKWLNAAEKGDIKRLENMIEQNSKLLTYQGKAGMTALHAVIKSGKATVDQKNTTITFLLKKAQEFNETEYVNTYMTKEGWEHYNALTLASSVNMSVKIIAQLINDAKKFELELKINQQDSHYEHNALLEACYRQNQGVVIFLVNNFQDLNLNAKTKKGYTGLLMAAEGRNYEIMNIILAKAKEVNYQLDVNSQIQYYYDSNNYSALALLLYHHRHSIDHNNQLGQVKSLIKSLIELGSEIDDQAKKWGKEVKLLEFMQTLVKKQQLQKIESVENKINSSNTKNPINKTREQDASKQDDPKIIKEASKLDQTVELATDEEELVKENGKVKDTINKPINKVNITDKNQENNLNSKDFLKWIKYAILIGLSILGVSLVLVKLVKKGKNKKN